MSLSQVRRLNGTVAVCRRYRLSEDTALLTYTLMILKRSDRFSWAWIVVQNVRYSTINDENKYKSKDHLFISKTTIMVNRREKNLLYNFYFRQTAILFLYFFNFIPFLFFVFSTFFVLILSYLCERAHSLLPTYLGGIFSPLLDISERNFFPRWGGGGCTCTQCTPPLRTRLNKLWSSRWWTQFK